MKSILYFRHHVWLSPKFQRSTISNLVTCAHRKCNLCRDAVINQGFPIL